MSQSVAHLIGCEVGESQQDDLSGQQSPPVVEVDSLRHRRDQKAALQAAGTFRTREDAGRALILGQIMLDDALDDGAGLARPSPCIDGDVRVEIERQSLGGVQSHLGSPRSDTGQIDSTRQYMQAS